MGITEVTITGYGPLVSLRLRRLHQMKLENQIEKLKRTHKRGPMSAAERGRDVPSGRQKRIQMSR